MGHGVASSFFGVSLGAAQRTAFCLLISAGNASFFKKLNRGDVFCSSDVARPRRAGFVSAHAVLQGTFVAHPRAERVFLSAHVVLQLAGSGLQRAWREDRSWLRFFVSFVVLSLFVCFVVVCFCVFVCLFFCLPARPEPLWRLGGEAVPGNAQRPPAKGQPVGTLVPGFLAPTAIEQAGLRQDSSRESFKISPPAGRRSSSFPGGGVGPARGAPTLWGLRPLKVASFAPVLISTLSAAILAQARFVLSPAERQLPPFAFRAPQP